MLDSESLGLAFFVARRAHAGQTRGGGRMSYLEHPIRVAELLEKDGADEAMIAAALLHDVVEDSGFTVGDVVESFGVEVGELVAALTDDPAIADWEQRKVALREHVADAGPRAAAIYTADKIANLHDWRTVYAELGEGAVEHFKAPTIDARVRAWRADLEMVERVAPGLALLSRLRADLGAFESERRALEGARGAADRPLASH